MFLITFKFNKKFFKNLLFLFFLVMVIYGIVLYFRISRIIDGKIWTFPISIYSRIIVLEPGNNYSIDEIVSILKSIQYTKVKVITVPGEFSTKKNSLMLVRRSFFFPEGWEGKIYARLLFNKNRLIHITNMFNNRDLSILRLDSKLITMIQSPKGEQRLFLSLKNYPKILIRSLLAIEDKCFYYHDGINLYSIIRSFLANITSGRIIQGGSTVTQQLIKNLFLTSQKSFWRKFNEIYMALILDWKYSKEKILELYLNEVYLGQEKNEQIRGFPLASLYYFGRPINELSVDQYALLVGMIKGASLYNPWNHPVISLHRRNLVLKLLFKQKIIDEVLYKRLYTKSLNIKLKEDTFLFKSDLIQVLKKELKEKVNYEIRNCSGMKIFTTLDLISQQSVENSVKEEIEKLKLKKRLQDLEISIIVIDKFSGEIRGFLGGANSKFIGKHSHTIQSRHSIGSLSKPITYLTALSQPEFFNLNTLISNEPIILKLNNRTLWKPKNNNVKFSKRVMLINALASSINIPTINLTMKLGLKKLVDSWIELGVPRNKIFENLSVFLDSINLTPMEVAEVFQVIASGGNKINISLIRSILSEDNILLYHSLLQSKRIKSEQASYLTLYAMQEEVMNYEMVKHLGTEFKNFFLAGKIGETNDLINNWFVGIDGKQLAVVWIGRENNKFTEFYGFSGAIKIYSDYLKHKIPDPLVLNLPKNVHFFNVNKHGNLMCDSLFNSYRILPIWVQKKHFICNKM